MKIRPNPVLKRSNQLAMAIAIVLLPILLTGCRGNGTFLGPLAGGPRIAPPATYFRSNNPMQAQNQYYNQNATAQNPNGLLTPSSAAPTPAGARNPVQGQWQPKGNTTLNPTGLGQPTTSAQPNTAQSFATNPAPTNNGLSFTSSPNYESTSVDERNDRSRLMLTDATAVRAPIQYQNPNAGMVYQPQYNVAQAGFQNSSGARVQPQIVGGQPRFASNITPYNGQPVYSRNSNFGQPVVLAESTIRSDPSTNPSYHADWRAREPNPDMMR